jgi:hypothetical protein
MTENNELIPEGFYKDPKTGAIICKECSCGKKNSEIENCDCQKITTTSAGLTGWVCPVCGRGNSPFSGSCPCTPMPPMQITCNIKQ